MAHRCSPTRCSPSIRSHRSPSMRYIDVSGVDRSVSAIGLGAGTVAFTPERYEDAAALLDTFLGAGGNLVDTAHIYGFGKSEMTLGRWFEETGRRDEVFLVTKGCHPVVDPDDMFARPWLPRVTPQADTRRPRREPASTPNRSRRPLPAAPRRGIGRARAAPRGPQPGAGAGTDPGVRRLELDGGADR